jgi:hypothetical protein
MQAQTGGARRAQEPRGRFCGGGVERIDSVAEPSSHPRHGRLQSVTPASWIEEGDTGSEFKECNARDCGLRKVLVEPSHYTRIRGRPQRLGENVSVEQEQGGRGRLSVRRAA